MTKQTHIAFGLFASLAIMNRCYGVTDMTEVVYGSMAAAIAAPLPDVDLLDNRTDNTFAEIKETIKNMVPVVLFWAVMRYQMAAGFPDQSEARVILLRLFFYFIYLHFTVVAPHRAWSHSIVWGMAGMLIFQSLIPYKDMYRWFFWSFYSHLAIDLLNKTGEQVFWPIQTRACIKLCKADGFLNNLIMAASAAGYIYMMMRIQEGL